MTVAVEGPKKRQKSLSREKRDRKVLKEHTLYGDIWVTAVLRRGRHASTEMLLIE